MYLPAKQFTDIAKTKLGQALWAFLNQKECIIRMGAVSEVRRPAVEGVSRLLLKEFGNEVRTDRHKQMIGHMIRQILEKNGYRFSSHNVKVRFGNLFSKGSRYELA